MNRIFTKTFKRILLSSIIIFVLLFLFRLGYGYTLTPGEEYSGGPSFDSFESSKRNFASDDYIGKKDDMKGDYDATEEFQSSPEPIATVDQKYEKIADVQSGSSQFDEDEKYVRKQVEESDGIIQYERKYGNDGDRRLQLQIGVPPENFDSLYAQLICVGKIHSKEIIKNDKTNEYLELNARKASLEKTLKSLIEFKNVNGKIDEYINLENRILEIEEQLQNLGVNLGDFDESNEFCTIRFSLSETETPKKVVWSFMFRGKVALEWTIRYFAIIVVSAFFAGSAALVGMILFEKLAPLIKQMRGK